jgi:hypothetical protein
LLHVLAVFPELPDADDWVVIEEGAGDGLLIAAAPAQLI